MYISSESSIMLRFEHVYDREKILLEKEGSGCKVLLANDKSDDLSRMYRLFSRLPKGLEPMADIIKDHITEVRSEDVSCRALEVCFLLACGYSTSNGKIVDL